MQTSAGNIYAAGDCIDTPMLAYTAYKEAETAVSAYGRRHFTMRLIRFQCRASFFHRRRWGVSDANESSADKQNIDQGL